jgi:hypothetical protein
MGLFDGRDSGAQNVAIQNSIGRSVPAKSMFKCLSGQELSSLAIALKS